LFFKVCKFKCINSNRIFRNWFKESKYQVRSKKYIKSTKYQRSALLINQVKRVWTYQEHLKIKEKSQELSDASVIVSVEKLNQSKSDEISICSKNTSKRTSFNDDSLVFLSSFLSLMMFWNFHLIIIYLISNEIQMYILLTMNLLSLLAVIRRAERSHVALSLTQGDRHKKFELWKSFNA